MHSKEAFKSYPEKLNVLEAGVHCLISHLWLRMQAIKMRFIFTARRYASVVLAVVVCLCVCLSVCLSVRVSVCLSQAGIVSVSYTHLTLPTNREV